MIKNYIVSYGITGNFGLLHTKISINYGTKIYCGINFKKNGGLIFNLPIYSTVLKSIKISNCKICIIYLPFFLCKNAILECIYSGINIIICIAENISFFDMLIIKYYCTKYNIIFIGPNSPGIIIPHLNLRLGIFPIKNLRSGNLCIISKSGTLTYEAIKYSSYLTGQSICIGIGGDVLPGINIKWLLNFCYNYCKTNKILIIGEIGGNLELLISKFKKKKKIIFYIVGIFSPLKKQMGHAGAINNLNNDVLIKIKKIKKNFLIINCLSELKIII